jgi:hypothetical protein
MVKYRAEIDKLRAETELQRKIISALVEINNIYHKWTETE